MEFLNVIYVISQPVWSGYKDQMVNSSHKVVSGLLIKPARFVRSQRDKWKQWKLGHKGEKAQTFPFDESIT